MKSDRSKGMGPNFSDEPGPPDTQYVDPPTQYNTIALYYSTGVPKLFQVRAT